MGPKGTPTFREYLLKIANNREANKEEWEALVKVYGLARLRKEYEAELLRRKKIETDNRRKQAGDTERDKD